jgi:vacuolar-type H+-ATPase subunit F/Vma7
VFSEVGFGLMGFHTDTLGDEPRRVLDELSELRTVDVVLATKDGREIRTRCITQPTDHQKIILQHLGWELPTTLRPIQM